MSTSDPRKPDAVSGEPVSPERRRALKRLGIAAGAAYLAPAVLGLNESAANSGPPWTRPSKPSEPSKPSKPKP